MYSFWSIYLFQQSDRHVRNDRCTLAAHVAMDTNVRLFASVKIGAVD